MAAERSGWTGLAIHLGLAALCAAFAALWQPEAGHDLPPSTRFGLVLALILVAMPVLQGLWQLPPPGHPRRAAVLRGVVLFGTFWFLGVAILNDVALPSAAALPWLGMAAVLGIAMAAFAAASAAPDSPRAAAPPRIAGPLMLAAATVAIATLPVMSGAAPVLFTLILAFALADRPLPRRATLTPPEGARLALAATALTAALVAAR